MARSDFDGDDRDDDEAPLRRSVPFPGIVTAAGVIWIGIGALGVIGAVATMGLAGQNPGANPAGGGCCPGLIGLAFLICGLQTVNGTATDTRGNGAGSLILGFLQLLAAGAIAFGGVLGGQNARGGRDEELLVLAAILSVQGGTLILAGLLALAGRSAYLEWKAQNAPKRRRRERREDDE